MRLAQFIFITLFLAMGVFSCNLVFAGSVTGDIEAQEDNEGLSTFRYLVGYQDLYGKWVLGAKVGQFRVKDSNGQINFDELRFTFYKQYDKKLSTWGYLGYLDSNKYSLVTGDLGVGYVATNKLYLEFGGSKNAFDTFRTNSNRVSYSSATARAEYRFTNNLIGTGIVTLGSVSDGNDYNVYKGYLDYNLDSVDGLTLKYQHRYKGYGQNGTGYFSPRDWTRNLFGVGYKKTFTPKWSFKGSILTGPQTVDNLDGQFTELKTFVQWKVAPRTTFKFTHDRVISEVNGYNYKWNWTGLKFQHNF